MRHIILRFASLVWPPLLLALILTSNAVPLVHAQSHISVQEGLLRAKPAVVVVVSEVSAEVTLDCGAGPTKVTPPVFRETGTGWFVDGDGWVVTNGHVVQPAHETPRWLVNQQAQRAVVTACLPKALERARIVPGEKPEADDAVKRKLLDKVLPTTKVNLTPQVVVVISNGTRIKAEVKKYSPPVSTEPGAMSGRDLALLKISGDAYPVLPSPTRRWPKSAIPFTSWASPASCRPTSS